jgi:hypothetical protein
MAEQTHILSHWTQHLEGLNQSTQMFYSLVEGAIARRKIPDVKITRIDFKEGGIFSSSREYLRIVRGDLRFDVCGAPFASGFFVSARLFAEGKFGDKLLGDMDKGGFIAQMTSGVAAKLVGADTYMKIDSAHMYQTLVHRGLLEAIDQMTSAANLPPIPEPERKPILKGFFQ